MAAASPLVKALAGVAEETMVALDIAATSTAAVRNLLDMTRSDFFFRKHVVCE